MSVRLPLRNGVIGLLACLMLASDCDAEPPTVEEVLAIYRANLEKLNPLHVQVTHTREWKEAYRESKQKAIDAKEQMIKMLESGSDEVKLDPPAPFTKEQLLQMLRDGLETDRAFVGNV